MGGQALPRRRRRLLQSRRCVGWAMAEHMRAELVVEALEMAIWQRRPDTGLIHHSDRGSQYVADLRPALPATPVSRSRWAPRAALDNAVCEAFFATLQEGAHPPTLVADLPRAPERDLHLDRGLVQPPPAALPLGYLSPVDYENELSAGTVQASPLRGSDTHRSSRRRLPRPAPTCPPNQARSTCAHRRRGPLLLHRPPTGRVG